MPIHGVFQIQGELGIPTWYAHEHTQTDYFVYDLESSFKFAFFWAGLFLIDAD